ncbi:Mu transposase domain-containing protein [Streptomyces chartreusis]
MPKRPYLVADRHLRHVGKDCLVAFEASLYSVPARRVRPRQLVEVRAGGDTVSLHLLAPDLSGSTLLAVHPRAHARGSWVVDSSHWAGLPDDTGRRTTTQVPDVAVRPRQDGPCDSPLQNLLNRSAAAQVSVSKRPLSFYDDIAGTRPRIVPDSKDTA